MQIDIGIPEGQRKGIADGLNKLLADTYTLYLKTHAYHWNVTGPMFQTLHLMFMTQYTELWNSIDLVAERIRSLGYFAPGSGGAFSKLTSIKEDAAVPKATDMIKNLVEGHEAVIKTARSILNVANEANDQATLDLITQRLKENKKTEEF